MDRIPREPSASDADSSAGVRLVVLNLPEDEGEGLGFRLTRTLWDPYPWVREVTPGARADVAGLKTGDCLLQADGKDLLGMPVGQVAGLIRGDGAGHGVSLLVWNCGVDPKEDPELLWSCGGGSRGERARRALAGVLRALSCCVCAATATKALHCARSHLYCEACWKRLERCALCREALPAKDSPYSRNLVAEQVFEAIATEYEIKNAVKKPTTSVSAYTSPNRSPNMSPATNRRGQYHLSMMNKNKKAVQFNGSDPNIHRRFNSLKSTNSNNGSIPGNTENGGKCNCQSRNDIPKIKVQDAETVQNLLMQHRLVARLRQASSMADLQNANLQSCPVGSRSMNNVSGCCNEMASHSGSLGSLKLDNSQPTCESPVFVLSAPPIYVLACDHKKE